MDENEPKIDLDMDDDLRGIVVITCHDCNSEIRKYFTQISPGDDVVCDCGTTFSFTGDDLFLLQRALDGLKGTLEDLGE